MAGLSGKLVLINVVKASEKVRPSVVEEPSEEELAAEEQLVLTQEGNLPGYQPGWDCPFGHHNPAESMFCTSCGISINAEVVTSEDRPTAEQMRPPPAVTDQERAERERKHMEAVAAAARFEHTPVTYEPPSDGGVLIHFIEDGLTAFGQVWYRGQELQIGPSSSRWAEAQQWVTLNRNQQLERWGKHFFEPGPWPGRRGYSHEDVAYEQLSTVDKKGQFAGPRPEELAAAEEAERRRGRGIPAPTFR